MPADTVQSYRWVDTGKVQHVAYEVDGNLTATLCRQIAHGGEIRHGKASDMESPCQRCIEATMQSLLVKEEVVPQSRDRRLRRSRKAKQQVDRT